MVEQALAQRGLKPGLARAITAQMALETGYGRSTAGGNNMAGIKAHGGWQGPVVEKPTTEFVDGRPVVVPQRFRAYDNWQQSVEDYVNFILSQPRYARAGALDARTPADYFASLQRAGYATDPAYADKLGSVYQRLFAPA